MAADTWNRSAGPGTRPDRVWALWRDCEGSYPSYAVQRVDTGVEQAGEFSTSEPSTWSACRRRYYGNGKDTWLKESQAARA